MLYEEEDLDQEVKNIQYEKLQTYDDYLDKFVTPKDIYYFDSEEIPRLLVQFGHRVAELKKPEEIIQYVADLEAEREERKRDDKSLGEDIPLFKYKCPVMRALADRELDNRVGYVSCVIFLRAINKKGHEVSGYIDFEDRLRTEEMTWLDYYTSNKVLLPLPTDLSYYNWSTYYASSNVSSNYSVITDVDKGLRFMNKTDRKVITVNSYEETGDNTTVTIIESPYYLQCTLYDHSMRTKM